ncbi:hypothetical protein [Microlunatus speluncae]|uniref:hypothetical protein n=1 Tax=Microlunatus speluncae TaxID=2594267 RepID=UPI0012664F32|nr:hypothetical protein [Microlunatus speluncae]
MRRRWIAIPVALIMVALAACGPEDKPGAPVTPVASDTAAPTPSAPPPQSHDLTLAKKFAPLVRLGAAEEFLPIDAVTFIDRSELRWNRKAGLVCPDQKVDKDPTAQKLADPASYRTRRTAPRVCTGRVGDEFNTTEKTRPYTNDKLGAEGYFLDADNDVHQDGSASAPAYVEYVDGKDAGKPGWTGYVYWFFYPYNRWTNPIGGFGGNHEGDWERVTVVIDPSGKADGVVFSQHRKKCRMAWPEVAGKDGHPVVYAAVGTHGSYPVGDARYAMHVEPLPDQEVLEDETSTKGEQWKTWDTLREVKAEPWWGYGGGWGEVGSGIPKLSELQTGPAGPSTYKSMTAEAFSTDSCPKPVSVGAKPTADPKLAAVKRLEEYLHAVGREDAEAACKISVPESRPLCRMALPIAFGELSKKERSALKTATVDLGKVRKAAKDRYEIPTDAIPADVGGSEGTFVMVHRDGEWYLTE